MTSRSEQIREDTVATLNIASEMVHALFGSLSKKLEEQKAEIARLHAHIRELESVDEVPADEWIDYDECETSSNDTTSLAEDTNLVRFVRSLSGKEA